MATTAHVYIVDDDVAWRRLNALAAADWLPGSPGELLYLNALVGDAATMHLVSAEAQTARLGSLTAHLEATGDAGGLHGPLLSLMNAAVRRGDAAAVTAAAATWQKFAVGQAPRAVAGAVPVYDTATRALVLADPARVASALPPLPTGLSDTSGIVNFLNGIDRRIHDAFGDPQPSNAAFDAETASVVSSLNDAAVTVAQMAAIGMLIPGGQAIGAILLVGAGVLAVGAAAVSLFGSLVDLFTSTEPAKVDVPDAVVPPNPYQPGDQAEQPVTRDPIPIEPPVDDSTPDHPGGDPPVDPASNTDDIPVDRETDPPTNDTPVDNPPINDTPVDPGPTTTTDDIPDTRESETSTDSPAETGGQAGGEQGGTAPGGGGEIESVHDVLRVADAEGDEDAGHR